MRLEVADETALVATLQAGLIPKAVLNAPVRVHRGPAGLQLEPSVPLSSTARAKLRRAGIQVVDASLEEGAVVPDWVQVVQCHRDQADAQSALEPPTGEVLFLVEAPSRPMTICAELLRLGCVNQQLASFVGADGSARTMIKVMAPPYYVVLRALDRAGGLRVFSERAPNVWLELGWSHPLTPGSAPARKNVLLIPAAGHWMTVPDGPWTALDPLLQVEPPLNDRWTSLPIEDRISVSLRLEPFSRAPEPRLWVLAGDDVHGIIERWLSTVPSSIVDQIHFARVRNGRASMFLLRSPQLGQPPPSLELPGSAFAPRADLPNLYLPVGTLLAPPLTSEQIRMRIAPDPDELVWVEDGQPLVAHRVAENAFTPLADWADYVIAEASEPLTAWMDRTIFDFDRYRVAADPVAETPQRSAAQRVGRSPIDNDVDLDTGDEDEPLDERQPSQPTWTPVPALLSHTATASAAEEQRLAALTRADVTLEDWLALGRVLAAEGRSRDAALAFARAAWMLEDPSDVYRSWTAATPLDARLIDALKRIDAVDAETLVAAHLLHAASSHSPPSRSLDLTVAQQWLKGAENKLPVHILWLTRFALAEAVGGDALGLLRTRDLITVRIEDGLSIARDVPSFVRSIGNETEAPPADFLRERLQVLWTTFAQTERKKSWNEAPEPLTRAYVAFLIKWGLARLGDGNPFSGLDVDAIDRTDPGHDALVQLYEARISQALDGAETSALVPAGHSDRIRELPSFVRFKVERLWQGSPVLGGASGQDPFRRWADKSAPAALPTNAPARAALLETLWSTEVNEPRAREAIAALGGLPEAQSIPMFARTLDWVVALEDPDRRTSLEALLFLAGHLDRADLVARTLDALMPSLAHDPTVAAALYGRTARIFMRTGLSDRIRDHATRLVGDLDGDSIDIYLARLALAGALAALGDDKAAPAAVAEALPLLNGSMRPDQHLQLVRQVCLALARTSAEQAAGGVDALVPRLASITDGFSTNTHFCLSVLHFMESLVLALTGRDLTVGLEARRWLDADEADLRERLHRDLQRQNP